MINIKNFEPNLLNIDKISFKKGTVNVIYSIKYITLKILDHVNIDRKNYLYLAFNNVDGYIIKESDENKYLIFAFTDKNEEVLEKYAKL